MPIRYVLFENRLAGDDGVYEARVRASGRAGPEEIAERMIARGASLPKTEIVALLQDSTQAIAELLLEGRSVLTDGANYRVTIKGNFEGPGDRYDPSRHQVDVSVSPGRALRQAVREQARFAKKSAPPPQPRPGAYLDLASGTRNSILTPGGMGRVLGSHLQYDPDDAGQGIFFLTAGRSATRVQVVARNMPRELIFAVPPLAPGEYRLEVRAAVYGNSARRGGLDKRLVVE